MATFVITMKDNRIFSFDRPGYKRVKPGYENIIEKVTSKTLASRMLANMISMPIFDVSLDNDESRFVFVNDIKELQITHKSHQVPKKQSKE